MAALALLGLDATALASTQVSLTRAWGWGVADGASQFETCTITCQSGREGGGAGEFYLANGVAVDGSGDVFVADYGNSRIEEFSSSGAFIRAWGWGVADGASQFETCTTTCRAGLAGGGAGQLNGPDGIAVDGSGDVFVSDDHGNGRVDEFSSSGAFVQAWGWGVLDGQSQLETCTTTCRAGGDGGSAGELDQPSSIAVDGSGDVFVTEVQTERVDEFSSAGAFIKAWGWGVADGKSQFETCTTTCQTGSAGAGAGQLDDPDGIAVDASDDVFVTDYGDTRVDEFSASGAFVQAWGWGVADGKSQFETCTTTCQSGQSGGGSGQLYYPLGVAVDGSGDVFVGDYDNARVDEFSSAGAFIQAWGWGVADGKNQLEECTAGCQSGLAGGGGAGQLDYPDGIAVDGSGDVFVTDSGYERVDEFGTGSIPQKTLTVSKAGSGSGTVTSGDGGIVCGATCSHSYASATMVTLTAMPTAGSTFAGWSGGGCAGTATCTVTMSSDQAVSAKFNALTAKPSCSIRVASAEVLARVKNKGAKKGKRPKGTLGTLRFHVRCDQSASVALAGTVTEVVKRRHAKSRAKTFKVATVRGSVTAGATITMTVKLPRAALAALAAGARESALFTLTATNANGTSTATAKVARLKLVRV